MEENSVKSIKILGKEIILSKKLLIIASAVLLAVIVAVVFIVIGTNNKIKATTMRLLKMEGTVTLEENGVAKTVKENLRFKSGDALSTGLASLVAVGLDDTKVVTLDELSRAEFEKNGKHLLLNVTDGSIFFNVTEKLEADASFEIHTSNTTVGIRGTSGVVCKDDHGRYSLYLTDGSIKIKAKNPDTGEEKEIEVTAPAKVSVFYYNDAEKGHTVEFAAMPLEYNQLPQFAVEQIYHDEELTQKIAAFTGWEVTEMNDIGKKSEDGEYEPKESDLVKLGIAEPDDIAKKLGITGPDLDDDDDENIPKLDFDDDDDGDESDSDGDNTADGNPAEEEPVVEEPHVPTLEEITVDTGIYILDITEDGKFLLSDGTIFDPAYYALMNEDVVRVYGSDPYVLLMHYLQHGRTEERFTNEDEEHITAAKKVEEALEGERFQKEQAEAQRKALEEENQSSDTGSSSNTTNSSSTPSAAAMASAIRDLEMGQTYTIGSTTIARISDGFQIGDYVASEVWDDDDGTVHFFSDNSEYSISSSGAITEIN